MSEYTVIDLSPEVEVLELPFVIVPNVEAPPSIVTDPSIGAPDTPRVGDTLTAWPGVWSAVVDSYAYQWYRDGVAIGGATGIEYEAVDADEGADLTVGVTATNAEGSSTEAVSAAIGPVQAEIVPPETGRIYPATLALYGTHDPTDMLVGSPTLDANGDVTVTVAAGGVVGLGDSAALYFTFDRDSAGASFAAPLPLGQYLASMAVLIEGAGGGQLANPVGSADRIVCGCGIISDPTAAPTSPSMTADTDQAIAGCFADSGSARAYAADRASASAGGALTYPVDYVSGGADITSQENRTNDAQAFIDTLTSRINKAGATSAAAEGSVFVHRYVSAVVWLRRISIASNVTFTFRPSLQLVLESP